MHNKIFSRILFLILVFCLLLTKKDAHARLIDTVIVTPSFNTEFIGSKCFYRTGKQFELFNPDNSDWKSFDIAFHQFGFDSIHWIYTAVKNKDHFDKTLKLFINNVQAADLKLFLITEGKVDSSQITGSMTPVQLRSTTDRALSFSITIPSEKTTCIYFRQCRKLANITIIPVLIDPGKSQFGKMSDNLSFISVFILLLILFAALILLINYYYIENFWLFAHMFCAFLYVCAAFGYGSLYLWPSHPNFEENATIFLGNLSSATFFEFSRRALLVKQRFPKISKLVILFSIFHSVLGLYGFSFYGTSKASLPYSSILGLSFIGMLVVESILYIIAIIQSTRKQNREFLWFVGIFSFGLFYNTFAVLIELGKIPYSYTMQVWLLPIGVIPQMFLIFIFLARKAMHLLKEKEKKISETKLTAEYELLNERLRMSKNLHDDIGAELSGINLYSHLASQQSATGNLSEVSKSISIIQNSTTKIIDRLREIVWSISSNETDTEHLIENINSYINYISKPANIIITCHYDPDFVQAEIRNEILQNLFLICKEAVNNAVKYSHCTSIEINLKKIADNIECTITDDGIGFDTDHVKKGNGLLNMQIRTEDMNGHFAIKTSLNGGTSITMQIPLTPINKK